MRILRWGFGLFVIFGFLGLSTLSKGAISTASAAAVFVQVSPSSIMPGNQVTVRANCADSANTATVKSGAFDQVVTLHPVDTSLEAAVNVPATTVPGIYSVNLTCASGSQASTNLTVLGSSSSTTAGTGSVGEGPHTGGGFLASHASAGLSAGVGWLLGGAAVTVAGVLLAVISTRRRRPIPVRTGAARD
jgi:hypothetical protein